MLEEQAENSIIKDEVKPATPHAKVKAKRMGR